MKKNLTKIIIGSIFMLIGGFLFLRVAGIIPYININFWYIAGFIWPAILLIIGTKMIMSSNFTPGIILISLGLVFLLRHVFDWNFFSILWPMILIAIGVSIFFKNDNTDINSSSSTENKSIIKETVAFWGVDKHLTSKNFKSADINVAFGGYKLDLSKIKVGKEGAKINANAAFGGIEIIAPKEYKIISNGTGVFGGWENKIDNKLRKTPTIEINGTAIFGGVDIKE